jgi:hypothetical protein
MQFGATNSDELFNMGFWTEKEYTCKESTFLHALIFSYDLSTPLLTLILEKLLYKEIHIWSYHYVYLSERIQMNLSLHFYKVCTIYYGFLKFETIPRIWIGFF